MGESQIKKANLNVGTPFFRLAALHFPTTTAGGCYQQTGPREIGSEGNFSEVTQPVFLAAERSRPLETTDEAF